MDISTYEEWQKEEGYEPNSERSELLARFPYTVVATGYYPEHDYACRWCWQNIGPADGPCRDFGEYPGCPLVLETKRVERGVSLDSNGKEYAWKRTRYTNPGDHRHEGEWTFLWIDKVDYDYGYGEYFFAKEADRARFISAFPSFTWSESWDED